MLSSDIPSLVPLPFAESGSKNVIPSAPSPTPGLASLTDGFPPLTSTPISAGGIPPVREDFNGIFNLLSANTQWTNAGGFYPYNSAFSTAIGGYPKGAFLAMVSGSGLWLSTADNNSVNPESGPSANWIAFGPINAQSGAYTYAIDTGAANAYVVTLSPVPPALLAGMRVSFIAGNTNTGSSTLNLNGLGAKSLTLRGSVALLSGDIQAGAIVYAEYDGTRFQVLNPATMSRTVGTPTNNNAYAGSVGEVISSTVLQGSAVSLVTNTPKTITSITLTPGDWDVFPAARFLGTSTTTFNTLQGSSSLTTNAMDDLYSFYNVMANTTPGQVITPGWPCPYRQVSINSNTTIYLTALGVFSSSTLSAYGTILARRAR